MPNRIQLRKDTLANWLTENPVLMDGEMVLVDLETTPPKVVQKIGDGHHTFKDLPYSNAVDLYTQTTWAELKALRDESKLTPGMFYRITDYTCTTTQKDTESAGHQFDIIVLALSKNTLCEEAKAILHEGDTYFSNCDLNAWELWYCLDNDKTRFGWADEENGRGVIYRMIDEWRNDCPYDFKNIMYQITIIDKRYSYFTFSMVTPPTYQDATVLQINCQHNKIGPWNDNGCQKLNTNIFVVSQAQSKVTSYNTLEPDCRKNYFGHECRRIHLGANSVGNSFGFFVDESSYYNSLYEGDCYNIQTGSGAWENKFHSGCNSMHFGRSMLRNRIRKCSSITAGDRFEFNDVNSGTSTFGYWAGGNTIDNSSTSYIQAGDYFHSNKITESYYLSFTRGCSRNVIKNCGHLAVSASGLDLNGITNRNVSSPSGSIDLGKKYYDDGSGQVVPIKHPDLSTQPSILPYKFMGQYVYEQLIPTSKIVIKDASAYIPDSLIGGDFILDCCVVGTYGVAHVRLIPDNQKWYLRHDNIGGVGFTQFNYIKIVYTSMPEDEVYYYDTENIKKANLYLIYHNYPGDNPVVRLIETNIYDYTYNDGEPIPLSDFGKNAHLKLIHYPKFDIKGYGYSEDEARTNNNGDVSGISYISYTMLERMFGSDFKSGDDKYIYILNDY